MFQFLNQQPENIQNVKWIMANKLRSILRTADEYDFIIRNVKSKIHKSKTRTGVMYDLDQVIVNHRVYSGRFAQKRHEKFCKKVKKLD